MLELLHICCQSTSLLIGLVYIFNSGSLTWLFCNWTLIIHFSSPNYSLISMVMCLLPNHTHLDQTSLALSMCDPRLTALHSLVMLYCYGYCLASVLWKTSCRKKYFQVEIKSFKDKMKYAVSGNTFRLFLTKTILFSELLNGYLQKPWTNIILYTCILYLLTKL